MTTTQQKIIDCLTLFGECTKQKLSEQCSPGYYNNGDAHFGSILSNMVNKGMIERIRKGVFRLPQKEIKPVDFGLFKETSHGKD